MKKAYVSITYLFTYDPNDLNLPEDCSNVELEDQAAAVTQDFLNTVEQYTFMSPNDIEIEAVDI